MSANETDGTEQFYLVKNSPVWAESVEEAVKNTYSVDEIDYGNITPRGETPVYALVTDEDGKVVKEMLSTDEMLKDESLSRRPYDGCVWCEECRNSVRNGECDITSECSSYGYPLPISEVNNERYLCRQHFTPTRSRYEGRLRSPYALRQPRKENRQCHDDDWGTLYILEDSEEGFQISIGEYAGYVDYLHIRGYHQNWTSALFAHVLSFRFAVLYGQRTLTVDEVIGFVYVFSSPKLHCPVIVPSLVSIVFSLKKFIVFTISHISKEIGSAVRASIRRTVTRVISIGEDELLPTLISYKTCTDTL